MKTWLTLWKYKHWIGYGVLLLAIPAAYVSGYQDGQIAEERNVKIVTLEKIIEVEKKHAKKKAEIRRLNDDELIKRYCASSVFDIPYDQCVRNVTYVE